jgi:hypothetical protein
MNPRIPIKRTNIHGDEGNEDANLESYDTDKFLATETGDHDEGAAGEDDNSSLWIDPRKTPMDRIQVIRFLSTFFSFQYFVFINCKIKRICFYTLV